MRRKVYESPTSEIQFEDGVLRQRWRIQWRDDDTLGAANPETYEWRDVPRVRATDYEAGKRSERLAHRNRWFIWLAVPGIVFAYWVWTEIVHPIIEFLQIGKALK